MENENQSNPRFVLFIALSFLIFLGWSYAYEKLYPSRQGKEAPSASKPSNSNATGLVQPAPTVVSQTSQPQDRLPVPAPQVELREIKVRTDLWHAVLSNQGAVLTEWTMTKFTDGKQIDAEKGGVNLVSARLTHELGGFF